MILTKYEHACFTLEKEGKLLIVDLGVYTTDIPALENVVAIIVTHEHADHLDIAALEAIIAHNPGATIYSHKSITSQLADKLPNHTVSVGDSIEVASFTINFMGGQHAAIHSDISVPPNFAIMINNSVYYPGDSFFLPSRQVDTLALPIAAPWMKMSEAFDFLTAVSPRMVFPTHDAILSDTGKALVDRMTTTFADEIGATYQRLSGPIEVDG